MISFLALVFALGICELRAGIIVGYILRKERKGGGRRGGEGVLWFGWGRRRV